MAVTIYAPNTAPLLPSTYPDYMTNYPNTPSYSDWVGSGGPSGLGPDPGLYLAVADAPSIVESRKDCSRSVNVLVATASGGETSLTFTLDHPVFASCGYFSVAPVYTSTDDYNFGIGTFNGAQIVGSLSPNVSVTGGVLSGLVNGVGTWWAIGHKFTLGAYGLPPLGNLHGRIIQITSGITIGSTMTAVFIDGPPPADFSSNSAWLTLVPNNGVVRLMGYAHAPFNVADGTIDFITGVVTLPCSPLAPGTQLFAQWGTRGKNLGDFQQPWSNLAALAAGSGSATNTLQPQTYNPDYGSPMFNNSDWLVCRDFGFALPSNAKIMHAAFCWEGGAIATWSHEAGISNLALLVDNTIQLTPYTQPSGDLSTNYYGDPGVGDYWGFEDLEWPGSTANDGSSEFVGSDLFSYDYFGTLTDPEDTTLDFNGVPLVGFAPKGLTAAQCNSPEFGMAVSAMYQDSVGTADVSVKSVRMLVWYELSGTPPITPTPNVQPPYSGSLYRQDGRVTTTRGPAAAGVRIDILNQGTGFPAQLYSDRSGTPLQNPLTSDGFGRYAYYVPSGLYTEQVAAPGKPLIFPDQSIGVGATLGYAQGITQIGPFSILDSQGNLAAIYSDGTGAALANPSSTDPVTGAFSFWASAGVYSVVSPNSYTVKVTVKATSFYRADGWVKTTQGMAVSGAQIYVCEQPCNAYPPIPAPRTLPVKWAGPNPQARTFADPLGRVPLTQPIISDGAGHYSYYVASGVYTEVVLLGGKVQQVFQDLSYAIATPSGAYRYDGEIFRAGGPAVINADVWVLAQPAQVSQGYQVIYQGNTETVVGTLPSPLAQIFSDESLLVPITQPLQSDAVGAYHFYMPSRVSGQPSASDFVNICVYQTVGGKGTGSKRATIYLQQSDTYFGSQS